MAPKAPARRQHTKEFFLTKSKRAYRKHDIIKASTQAFSAALAQTSGIENILFVDGFAGPGRYNDGDGSPVIMCKAILHHRLFIEKSDLRGKIHLVFIEANADHARELKKRLKFFQDQGLNIEVVRGEFQHKILGIMDKYKADANFIFADPFGYSGMPMNVLREILAYPRTDLLVNFMDGPIRRWRTKKNVKNLINELMGSEDWQDLERFSPKFLESLVSKYQANLKKSLYGIQGKVGSLRFAVKGKNNAHVYHLVFVTRHKKGMTTMKYGMYKNSCLRNGFMFTEFDPKTNSYIDLRQRRQNKAENAKEMVAKIKEEFKGRLLVIGEQIEDFVDWDPNYHFNFKVQLKKELKPHLAHAFGDPNSNVFTKLVYTFKEQEEQKSVEMPVEAPAPETNTTNEQPAPTEEQPGPSTSSTSVKRKRQVVTAPNENFARRKKAKNSKGLDGKKQTTLHGFYKVKK